jgi:hypothetical protein
MIWRPMIQSYLMTFLYSIRWMNEKISHLGEEVFMHTSTNDEFLALSNKYNIDDFAWMGIVSFTEEEKYVAAKIYCVFTFH